jgi:SAM-dependent methyltransferase
MTSTEPTRLVPAYEEGRLDGVAPPTWASNLRCLALAETLADGSILDCGAGAGWLTMHLRHWGHEVTACDYHPQACAQWLRNMEAAGYPGTIDEEDITRLSYPDAAFRTVFSFSVLEHIQEIDAALGELHRILQPGGRLVVVTPNSLGTFSLIYDHDWKAPLRRFKMAQPRGDVRMDHEQLHPPRWWHRKLQERFQVDATHPIEILSPLVARVAGYNVPSWVTRTDVKLAARLPRMIASDVMYVATKAA